MLAQKQSPMKKRKPRVLRNPTHRLRSVRLVLAGGSTVEVGRKYSDSQRAVANWVKRYKRHGVKGLQDAPVSGRPPKINQTQEKKLLAFLARAQKASRKVSGGILASFIKDTFGVTLTRRQCERILKRQSM